MIIPIDAKIAEVFSGAKVAEAEDARELAEWAKSELGLSLDAAKLTGVWTARAELPVAGVPRPQLSLAIEPGTTPDDVMKLVARLAREDAVGQLLAAFGGRDVSPKHKVTVQRGRVLIRSA